MKRIIRRKKINNTIYYKVTFILIIYCSYINILTPKVRVPFLIGILILWELRTTSEMLTDNLIYLK